VVGSSACRALAYVSAQHPTNQACAIGVGACSSVCASQFGGCDKKCCARSCRTLRSQEFLVTLQRGSVLRDCVLSTASFLVCVLQANVGELLVEALRQYIDCDRLAEFCCRAFVSLHTLNDQFGDAKVRSVVEYLGCTLSVVYRPAKLFCPF
jgi:hypothetical protein